MTTRLKKDPEDIEARNDLAAALMKLKRYGEAETDLLRIDSEHPDRYKTHANLGVLYKKTREFAKAAAHTKKALEIKPEGHLGLGDYYLRMLEWRQFLGLHHLHDRRHGGLVRHPHFPAATIQEGDRDPSIGRIRQPLLTASDGQASPDNPRPGARLIQRRP